MEMVREVNLEKIISMERSKGWWCAAMQFDTRFKAFDYAVPQNWLDSISEFAGECRPRPWAKDSDYQIILSTTVWAYGGEAADFGEPVSFCSEVNALIAKYNSKRR